LTYFSVCSGIEAASCAWEPLGWEPVGFSEIEPFPSAVLAHRFPGVRNYGDMTKYKEWENVGRFDVLVGGTPCQSFSVAGLRKGLDDPRGNLMLTFGAIADHFRPTWIVWENVPGVLSSNGGRDFGSFLGMLGELGYGFAYRVLDAQYFGVAQRRRRVFVVGYLGDWRRAAQVLFDAESLSGHTPPSRETREGIAFNAQGSACQGLSVGEITPTLDKSKIPAVYDMRGNGDGETVPTITGDHASRPTDYTPIIMSTGQGNAEITDGHAPTLNCNSPTLKSSDSGTNRTPSAIIGSTVRRLTPRECERLQGFPDDWTKIPWRGRPSEDCPDGNRYKACGNSMAVPVMRWIGERINQGELF
jgi:DNA (cytosine-5)-methyltransferase 1